MSIEERARKIAELCGLMAIKPELENAIAAELRAVRKEAFAEAAEKVRMSNSDLEIFRLAERVRLMGR